MDKVIIGSDVPNVVMNILKDKLELVMKDNEKLKEENEQVKEYFKKLCEKYEGDGEWSWAEVEFWIDKQDEEIKEFKENNDKLKERVAFLEAVCLRWQEKADFNLTCSEDSEDEDDY